MLKVSKMNNMLKRQETLALKKKMKRAADKVISTSRLMGKPP